LASVTNEWENCAYKASKDGIRTATMRFAVVLSKAGGLIAKLYWIFFLGTGGKIGNGNQAFSYVSLNDAVRAIEFAIENPKVNGPINVCSPEPTDNTGSLLIN